MRQSPLKFANEVVYAAGDVSQGYYSNWSAGVRSLSASQGYAIFQMCITAKAAGLYYLATGDMDAFDVMVAQGDFLGEAGANRDTGGDLIGWPYCWGDYWGFSDYGTSTAPGPGWRTGLRDAFCPQGTANSGPAEGLAVLSDRPRPATGSTSAGSSAKR